MTAPRPRLGRGGGIRRAALKAETPARQTERMGGKRLGSSVRPRSIEDGPGSQSLSADGTDDACASGLGSATAVHPIAEVGQAGWPGSDVAGSQGASWAAVWPIKAPQSGIPAGVEAAIAGAAPRSARTAKTTMTRLRTATHMSGKLAKDCQSFNRERIHPLGPADTRA